MDFIDYYKTLGVQPNASLENIRTAYRKLSKKFHPDVNNGDKFFEEKFREIQEAYEILCDSSKRKQYDYKRAILNKSNNTYNQEHEVNLRRKEEELRRQKDDFKKWEDSLKRKEEILKEKEKPAKKLAYIILILLLVTISIGLIYFTIDRNQTNTINLTTTRTTADTVLVDVAKNDNFKQPFLRTKILNGKTYQQDIKGDWHEVQSSSAINYPSSTHEALNIEFRNSGLAKTIDGKWTGSAYQYDIKESWTIKFTCNSKEGIFLIEYPSLGCSGTLVIENITNNEIKFIETIQKGNGICNNNGVVKLKKVNNKKLVFLYYSPYSIEINAKGKLSKVSK